ncbi:hypothetical protein X762_19580 [Mesorhizobium sp. LSHC426A00]|uniref:DUF982 domain-containing protein n=1 Tax=unclassified Mesorhizobium TaxID=325217 RepID=UPI0003CEA3A7|nr:MULTISPECIES: DUF982 domain-containing protein [unclassified Mesorhizobium]ESX47222.1 hypothetical protein X762_19580 [Mesorhizobium sp. LSHC426A00]ESX56665.1 hypothetical protein X761_10635 [Mesorhizobium sp. LSHC424B00]ESX71237.1 hypothetical protein X758_15155 [Mesorhizobium sp. LSHC416B00]
MSLHWFNPPVPVSGARAGMTYNVSNVEAASDHLLQWTKRGPKWNLAVRVCMAALADQATAQEARRAFRAAAKEEGSLRLEAS